MSLTPKVGLKQFHYKCSRDCCLNFAYDDEGQMLENMVYNELIYNGYTVNVGAFEKKEKDKNGKSISKSYEIDFVARRGKKK